MDAALEDLGKKAAEGTRALEETGAFAKLLLGVP